MKKKILALILAAVVFNTGIYYPADSYAYEGVDAVSAQMEDGTTGKNSEQASDHTETQDLQNPQEKDHQVQNQDGQESDDGSQIQPVSEEQDQETGIETEVETQAEKTSVSYRTHVQTYGWQDYVKDGETSGTSGQSKRLEGIQIKLEHPEYTGDIEYRTHVQTYGWQNYVKNDAMAGTTGQSKRLEAIQIRLTGEMAEHYDIYYRVHSQTYGWLDWAKNGEYAGTAGYSKRLEAIEIRLIEKGGAAPGPTEKKYLHPMISYRTHVQTYGWQGYVQDGNTSGTTGQSKRLEGINIKLNNQEYNGGVRYKTHVQTYGWQDWKSDGAMAGTEGQSKRLEAIQIELTGEMANHYDIYYRVHCQTYGWMGWAKNGQLAGTAGYSKRLEGIEIKLVSKGAAAPGKTDGAYTEPHTHTWVEITKEEPVVEEMFPCDICNDKSCNANLSLEWLQKKGNYKEWYQSGGTYEGENTLLAYFKLHAEDGQDYIYTEHLEKLNHPGFHTEYMTVDTGLTKTVVTGYKCSGCGATK